MQEGFGSYLKIKNNFKKLRYYKKFVTLNFKDIN